jgi:chaperonin cofactor prefoldin
MSDYQTLNNMGRQKLLQQAIYLAKKRDSLEKALRVKDEQLEQLQEELRQALLTAQRLKGLNRKQKDTYEKIIERINKQNEDDSQQIVLLTKKLQEAEIKDVG